VASLAVQALLVGPAKRRLGARAAMPCALSLTVACLLVFGLAPTGGARALGVPFLALHALSGPMTTGYFSARVTDTEQGSLQGAGNSLMGLAALGLFTLVFARAISLPQHLTPGALFFLCS